MIDMRAVTVTLVERDWVRVACKENKTTFDYLHIDAFVDMMPPVVGDALKKSHGHPVGLRLWAAVEEGSG
jgi:hypothetical protein